jgi:hypothetical protein
MTGNRQFWPEINARDVRGISIRAWPEEPDLKKCESQITSAISILDLWPARVEISVDIWEKSKVRKWRQPADATLTEFETVEGISALSGLSPTKVNAERLLRSIHIDQVGPSIYFEGGPDFLSMDLALEGLEIFLPFVTPRYGFSEINLKGDSYFFHQGQPTSGLDERRLARSEAFEAVRICKPDDENFLGNRLLDVFELNILSPAHMALRVFGTSLDDWISAGRRGTLTELKKEVYAWIVPDDIRADIRKAFLSAGYLIVPV